MEASPPQPELRFTQSNCCGQLAAVNYNHCQDTTYRSDVAFLIYTGLRLLLLIAVMGLLYSLGMRGFLLLVVGFVVSGMMSYILLRVPREAMAQKVGGVFGRINNRIENAAQAEDEAQAKDEEDVVDVTTHDSETSDPSDTSPEASDSETSEDAESSSNPQSSATGKTS